ncbi:MGMT family protein [Rothia sp. P5764]|uniref:MGMT family protein n=1 Tax=unclassified Rothia (in: high G+C Gram-positive bacteria) TaxID=2689056 RepID=UPI003AC11163
MEDVRVERVLRVAESIPPGRVATYGDVGAVAGESPRVVGRVMATWGSGVPWWRVCNARGEIPGHAAPATERWRAEGTALTADGRVDLRQARVSVPELAQLSATWLAELEV